MRGDAREISDLWYPHARLVGERPVTRRHAFVLVREDART
jgi:hypothetical protein